MMRRLMTPVAFVLLMLATLQVAQAGGPWKPAEQEAFMTACVDEASKNITTAKAQVYCSCMLDKIMAEYSDPIKAEKYLTDDEMTELAVACLQDVDASGTGGKTNKGSAGGGYGYEWADVEQEAFMESCVEEAAQSVGKGKANVYCACMLDKIMYQYATPTDASEEMSDQEMEDMAAECIAEN